MIHYIPKYIKLAEIVIVQVIGSMEDEHTFNTISFMRSKLKNRLTSHLDLVIYMFSQHFYTLENFAYDVVIQEWKEMCVWYGDDTQLLDFLFFGVLIYSSVVITSCNFMFFMFDVCMNW